MLLFYVYLDQVILVIVVLNVGLVEHAIPDSFVIAVNVTVGGPRAILIDRGLALDCHLLYLGLAIILGLLSLRL